MALDPLRFAIEIVDEASSKLTNIKTLIDGLNNKEITVNVQGNLREVLDILSKSGTDANALSGLQNALSGALSALEGLGNAARNGDLGTFSTEVGKAAAEVNGLATAFEKMNVAVGSNESSKSFMTGVGELVSRTNSAMKQLNSVSGNEGGNDSADKGFLRLQTSIQKAKYELYEFDNLIKRAESTSRLGKQFGDVDTNGLDKAIEKAKTFRAELEQISKTGKGENDRRFDRFALDSEYKKAVDQVRQLSAEQHTSEMNLGRYNAMLKETDALWDRIIAAWVKGSNLNVANYNTMQPAERQAHDFYQRLKSLNEADLGNVQIISQLAAEFQRLKGVLTATAKEQEKLNAATEKANKKAQDAAAKRQADVAKQAQKENEKWAQSMTQASNEANKLGIKIRDLQRIEEKGSALGVDTSKLKDYIHQLEIYKSLLESISNGYRGIGHTSEWIKGTQKIQGFDSLGNTMRLAGEAAANVNRLSGEQEKAARTTSQLTAEEQRLAQALNQTTEHARGQSQVLSDLKSMAMQYLGVWGGQQFLHNIIEIGGQLEMQRLSIGAILQNQSQANDLFERIKGLAVQSPFGVVELDQMTKQLTAYGFKYNELFDMTKRLADISAATGTGVDRLALALGHVRSEAALSGYTLRQFSMANVPLLQKLSEKLGKTTQEIRKMVRAKEVSYEDVIGVLKDITNEGGMFYNMQEVISQSVKAKFKNVKDAMDIMYGEMAEGYIGDSLKGVAEALMEVTRNWKDAATVLGTGAALWAAQRVAVMAYTTTLGKTNAAVLSSIAAHGRQEASVLSLANKYRVLTVTEQERLAASRKNVVIDKLRIALGKTTRAELDARDAATKRLYLSDLQLAMSEKKLTVEALARLVATGKVTKAEALQIVENLALADSEKMLAANMIMGTKHLGMFKMGLLAVGNAARSVAIALKSLIFNPAMLGMAAITGIVELWQRNNAEMERAKELGDAIFEASQEGLKNARQMMQNTGIEAYQSRDGKLVNLTNSFGAENESVSKTFLIKPEFDPSTAQQIIEEWSQYIREYSGTPNKMLNDALLDESGNVRMLKDQFDQLYLSVEQVIKSQKGLASIADIFQMAQEDTGSGWLNEDIVEDIKDYDKALKSFNKTIITTFRNNGRAVKAGIDSARQFDANFAKNTEGMTSYGEMLKELVENYEKYGEAVRRFNEADYNNQNLILDIIGDRGEVRGAREEMLNELNTFISGIQSAVEAGEIVLDDSTKNGLMAMFESKFLGSLGNISDEAKKELRKRFAEAIGAAIDDAEETTEKRLADWQIRAGKVFEINKEIKVKTKTITDISEFAKAVQEDLKKKQDYIKNNASHINHVLNLKTSLKLDVNSLNDQIIALSAQVQKLVAQGKLEAAKSLNSIIQDELLPYRNAMMAVEENKKWLKSEGYPETEAAKDKSKNKSKSGSKKAYKDEEVEKWKERMRNIREAYREYEKWEKKVGEAEALSRIKREFSGLIDENTLNDIKNYRKEIEKIRNDAQARYDSQRKDKSKDYGKQAQQLVRDSEKALNEIDLGVFDRAAEKFKSDMERTLSDLTRKWDLFTSVRNATGNTEAASVLAGFGNDIPEAKDVAGAFKEYLQAEIAKMGDEVKIPIRFDKSMSKKEVEDMVKGALGGTKYKEQIDAITDGIQRWIELSKDAEKKAVDAYTAAMTKAMDYVSQVQRINAELAEQNRLIDENNNLSQEQKDRAKGINQANASMKILEANDSYKRFFNNVFGETQTELQGMANTIKAQLNDSLKKGAITAEDYAKRIKDIDNVMQQSEISDPDKWYNKGIFNTETMEQRYQRKYDEGNEINQKGADMMQQGIENGDEAMQKAGKEMQENGQKMMDGANKAAITMAIIDKVVHGIDKAIQGTAKAFDYLKEALDALGVESDTMSSVGDYLHTLGEMSSHVSASWDNFKSGNFVGAGVEAIGAVTSVIKGISQAHDNRLERAIERLREDVKSIEANTELIVRSRERTLGYDMGDVRRQMAQQYAQTQISGKNGIAALIAAALGGSQQNKSMYEYYMQNSQGTGYEQEYANLVEQREKYMEILKDQQDKKKKSNEEIEETKSKIAELDDQIRYFSQDLAKELWGIDIKGWADQLSDALASAFENGENMAKAYRDTVTNIIQQMMQKMMQMQILEPMFANLQKDLFGENGKGGVFDPSNPKGSMSKVTKIIGDYFGKGGEGEKAITASIEFMTAFQRGMQSAGLTVLNEASNTLSSGIHGTSEETSDLLAGYVNALRQDVSVNRILLTQYVTQLWPQYIEAYTAQVTSVSNIDNNVRVIMEMMQLGNGAMYEQIAAMRTRIDNIVMGIDRVSIR